MTLTDARVDGILQGADDYMAKPFRSREVIARVNMQMMIGKKRRELEERYLNRTAEMDTIAEYSPVGIARTTAEGMIYRCPVAYKHMTDPLLYTSRLLLLLQPCLVRSGDCLPNRHCLI